VTHRAFLWEQVEHIIGQGEAPCWTAPPMPNSSGQFGKFFQSIEIELDFGDGAIGQDNAAVGGAGLDEILEMPFMPAGKSLR